MGKLKWIAKSFEVWLPATVLLFALQTVGAQTKPDLTKPFKKCRVYGSNYSLLQKIASDNDNNFILQNGNNKLTSINTDTNLENWIFESGGTIESDLLADKGTLTFVTSAVDKDGKNFFLNSLSLKTGITNWQRKIGVYSSIKFVNPSDGDLMFLLTDTNSIIAVSKQDGMIRWNKNFPGATSLVKSLQKEEIGILEQDALLRVSAQTGNTTDRFTLKNRGVTEILSDENHILLGFSTGEVIKLQRAPKNKTDWKIKTGGGISKLIKIQDNILVASLDNFIYLFSSESGKLRWKRRVGGRISIPPLIVGESFAVIVNENNNVASVINLNDGKIVNLIEIEAENGFSGSPTILGNYLILQTYKGMYLLVNGSENC